MKKVYIRSLRALLLVVSVTALIWLAAPSLGFVANKNLSPLLVQGSYQPLGSLIIEKRDAFTGEIIPILGVGFTVTPNPYGPGILTVFDNDPNDANPAVGIILLNNMPLGPYTILEIQAPPGYLINHNPLYANVLGPGNPPAVVVSLDVPEKPPVPSLSETGLWILIGGFAAAIGAILIRKKQHLPG